MEGTIIAHGGVKDAPNTLGCIYCGLNNTLPKDYNIQDFNMLFCHQIYTFHNKRYLIPHVPECQKYATKTKHRLRKGR
jgi:hypothetical protein